MNCRAIAGRLLAVGAVTLFGLTTLTPIKASALTAVNTNTVPLEITPVCADTVSGTADPNNTTQFAADGFSTPTQTNSSTSCMPMIPPIMIPPVAPCVDGNDRANISSDFNGTDTFTVYILNNAKLCNDVTLYASSYTLPSNYDGTGFGDPTSYPQTLFASNSIVLPAGMSGSATITAAIPDSCNNTQVDLYYPPEITTVGAGGHGSQGLYGKILPSTGACEGGKGGGPTPPPITPTTPPIPTTPTTTTAPSQPATGGKGAGPIVATTTPAPTTLSNTGTDSRPASIIAALFLAAAVLVTTRRSKVTQ